MPATAEQLHDLAVLHRISLGRYSTNVVRKVMALLNRIEQSIISRLLEADPSSFSASRLEELLAELQVINHAGWLLVEQRMNGEVADLSSAEREFALRLAGVPLRPITGLTFGPAPTVDQIVAAVNARPFQGKYLRNWLQDTEVKAAEKVRGVIRQGFVEGTPIPKLVTQLRGTKAARYQDGAMEINRRSAEALVRTAITHTANVAAQSTWEANDDVVLGWQFVATLDSRTTITCAALHGSIHPLGKGPQPPRHVNCRSTSVPVLEPIPGVPDFEFPSYDKWLRAQPLSVQEDILGVTKARLFRQGGLTIDRFADNKGKVLTLTELRQRDSEAFEQAGL